MKKIFAGLMLFAFMGANAQTSTNAYTTTTSSSKQLTIEKVRAVILWDEQQHQAKAPISITDPVKLDWTNVSTAKSNTIRINYVEQRRSALLDGLGYGLLLARSFTKYGNTPNMNYDAMEKHYMVQRNLTGTSLANGLFGKQ